MLRAVALDVTHEGADGASQLLVPSDAAFWDHFVEFVQDRYDSSSEDATRARRGELPRFLCPEDGKLSSCEQSWEIFQGDYWISLLFNYEFFWRRLWEVGNRGRVVGEFQSECGFGFEDGPPGDEPFYIPGDGGGLYAICVDLTEGGPSIRCFYDDPAFYEHVISVRDDALAEALEEEGVETEEELEYGFEWSASAEIDPYYMHARLSLIDYPDQAGAVWWEGFEG